MDDNENTPPQALAAPHHGSPIISKDIVPSPEAVSAFMASLRAAGPAIHSPGVPSRAFTAGARVVASTTTTTTTTSRFVGSGGGSSIVMATPASGVSRHSPPAAAAAAGAAPTRASPAVVAAAPAAPVVDMSAEAKALRDAKLFAEIRANELEKRLHSAEKKRATLQSDMTTIGVEMNALRAVGENAKSQLRREKEAAAAATAALERVQMEGTRALQEREFTIEAQAGMLQQLSADLERAEKCREEAERARAETSENVLKLQADFDACAQELAMKQHHLHQMQSGGDIMGRASLSGGASSSRLSLGGDRRISLNGRSSLGGDRRTSGASADDVRAAESFARQSQERLLELVAARHAAEREAKEAREMAARWEFEVGERRAEMEVAQGELEASLELERVERRKAEEEYAKARDERDVLERLVEQRAEEIGSLEEKLQDATNAAATLKADCEERDALLRDGAAMLEAKEHELDEAATYALQLQQQLEQLEVERAEEEAKMQALKAKYPRTPMKSTPSPEREQREALVRKLQAENEAAVAAFAEEREKLQNELKMRDFSLSQAAAQLAAKEKERTHITNELAARGTALSPLQGELDQSRAALASMREEIDARDNQLSQTMSALRKAMSAEKRQTEAVKRLEMSLKEREAMVRNMDEQLRAAATVALESAASNANQKRELTGKLTDTETALMQLQATLLKQTHDNERTVKNVENEKRAAVERAESLELQIDREMERLNKLADEKIAAERACELERERRVEFIAQSEESAAQRDAQIIEREAELEGKMLRVQAQAEAAVEEAQMKVAKAKSDAEFMIEETKAELAAAQDELQSQKEELAALHDVLAQGEMRKNEQLESDVKLARKQYVEAEARTAEVRAALRETQGRCVQLEAKLKAAYAEVEAERADKKQKLAQAAQLSMRRENEAKAAHASLGTKLKAAEAAAADGAKEVDRLSGEISKLRGEVESQKALFNDSEADMKKLVDGLNAADDALAEAKQEAQEAKEKAKETETESLFFLGEMQVAVSEAEKKITTLSKTVTSRDMKLAQMTAEVKALKAAVRQREEKLEAADASHAKTMEDAVTSLKRAHAEELAAAKGEVEGLSNMLEMENDQLRQNLDEKRAKLSRLQADLGNAMEKNKMFMERCERARAAQTIAEETAAEAERRREEVVFMLRRAEEVHTQNVNATEKVHKLQVEELEDAVTKEKARANALGRAMWERGMRPRDLDADAAAALEDAVGGVDLAAAATTPAQTRLKEMTAAAGQISFSKLRASVEAKQAAIRRRSSMGLDPEAAASPELGNLRKTLALAASSVKKSTANGLDWQSVAKSAAPMPVTTTPPMHDKENSNMVTPRVTRMTRARLNANKPASHIVDAENEPAANVPASAAKTVVKASRDSRTPEDKVKPRANGSSGSYERTGLKSARMATRRKALRALQKRNSGAGLSG